METKHTEFEEMRQQLDILKNKLDNQTLVNDKLIRQSMLNKMSFMKKYTWVSFLVLLFIYYGYNEVRILFNMSWWFYGFTVLVMTFSVCFDAYINHVNKKEFPEWRPHSGFLTNAKDEEITQKVLLMWHNHNDYMDSLVLYRGILWVRCCEGRRPYIHVRWYAGWRWNRLNHRSSHRYMVISSYATH